jgi:hypothetical protein
MNTKEIKSRITQAIDELVKLRIEIDGGDIVPERSRDLVKKGVCLACELPIGDSREVRGCHEGCKKTITDKIKAGEYSELEAVQRGLILPAESGGRKRRVFDKERRSGALRAAETGPKYRSKKSASPP